MAAALNGAAQGRFEVPAGCGSEAEFRSELQRLLGDAPVALPASLRIASVQGAGYELRLALGEDLRVLRDPECRTLWRSAIVISAASIAATRMEASTPEGAPDAPATLAPSQPPVTPLVPASGSLSEPVSTPPASSPPAAPPSSPAAPAASHSAARAPAAPAAAPAARPRSAVARRVARRRRPAPPGEPRVSSPVAPAREQPASAAAARYGLSLGGGLSGGVLPGSAANLELEGRLELAPGGLSLALRYWPERSQSREGRGLDVSAFGGRAAGLFWVVPQLQLVGGLELNRLAGAARTGVSGRSTAAAWQLAPTLGLNLMAWSSRHLRLELAALGRLSLLRPRFVVTGFGDLYRVPALGADVMLRGVWFFR
jgi:hypothetical protein